VEDAETKAALPPVAAPTGQRLSEAFLRDTIAICQQLGSNLNYLVFEVVEAEQVRDLVHLQGIIA
jgi:EAL domain-containing protein (putative c-di-GMP-specific phosphodiesterase class I)